MSPHNLDYDSSSSDSGKQCKGCARMRPLTAYCMDASLSDRLKSKCRECCAQNLQRWRAKSRATDVDEPAAKRPKPEPIIHGEHLYVMSPSIDPHGFVHGLKVGRSGNIDRRSHELGSAMPFHLLILATFPGQGHLEEQVHALLAPDRNQGGRGREWFFNTLPVVLNAVSCAMQASAIVNGSPTAQQSSGTPWDCPTMVGSEEEGACHYSEASGELCEEEGREAGVSPGPAGEGEDCF